jgi:hypothetical protein
VATNSKSSIKLVDLDFDSYANSLKNYLRGRPEFKDMDFEGSNIAMLIDLLAYNTFQNAFYVNMAISEGFIDSAQLRNSLYSHAKELNYLPRSVRSAVARIKVDFEASGDSQPYIIPKGSQLSTLIKTDSYVFTVPETITVSSANTSFSFETDIYEGIYVQNPYIFVDGIENQRFKLTNKNVDTRSITVSVFEDGNEIGDIYKLSTTLLGLDFTSKVFFVQPSETGHYEVYFGDGNIGRKPKTNATVVIDYRISNGKLGNGARAFSVDFDPTSSGELLQTPFVEVIEAGRNGEEEETNESIRYYAPRHFQIQERTVVDSDYEIALKTEFPEINAISVYGGEEVEPPMFGRVFVSVDISNVDGLPDSKRDEYTKFLLRRCPKTIKPVLVEPDFTYLQVNSRVRYNLNLTTNSSNRIRTLVLDAVKTYNDTYLDDFKVTLRHSVLGSSIDDCDVSIVSNDTEIRAYKKLNPRLAVAANYIIDFGLNLKKTNAYPFPHVESERHIIESSQFTQNGELVTIADDGAGIVHITKTDESGNHVSVQRIGTVDYDKGIVSLNGFAPDGYNGSSLKFYAVPRDIDIASTKNNILGIEIDEINVDVEALRV